MVDQGDGTAKPKRPVVIWVGLLIVIVTGALFYRPVIRWLRPELTDAICQRADVGSAAIFGFLEERRTLDPYPYGHPLAGVPDDQQDEAWLEYLAASGRFQDETMAQFGERFGAEIRWLIEGFTNLGAWHRGRQLDDRAVNELGIRDLAIELATAARRLGCLGPGPGQSLSTMGT